MVGNLMKKVPGEDKEKGRHAHKKLCMIIQPEGMNIPFYLPNLGGQKPVLLHITVCTTVSLTSKNADPCYQPSGISLAGSIFITLRIFTDLCSVSNLCSQIFAHIK